MDEQARKHWRSGQVDDTTFRVEIWVEDGKAIIKSLQIGESPPTPYGEDEVRADDADAAFARAEQMVKDQLDAQQEIEQSLEDGDSTDPDTTP